ncbi:hypothetical protein EYF80_018631 [Liparis tanakae]|uniref:Uncharacterized protein n=1 Tax=Liparis tanakae TaxID=230148 RepID=A0A4Z2HZW8_9TELE|nr:hypothetical protein EYF80_018631 [Liparis tanakae]
MVRGHQTVWVGPSRGQQTVAHGGDIPDAQSLYDKLKSLDTSVELFFVPEGDIESKTECCCASVPAKHSLKRQCMVWQKLSRSNFGGANRQLDSGTLSRRRWLRLSLSVLKGVHMLAGVGAIRTGRKTTF